MKLADLSNDDLLTGIHALVGQECILEHLTEDNHEDLLRQASGKTKFQVLELLAAHFPRKDAPSSIHELPETKVPPPSTDTMPSKPAPVEPLAPARYKVQFTASAELFEKIELVTNLMRHANPSGDLSIIVERAIDLLLAQLEKRKLGRTPRPIVPRKITRPGYVTRAVRREVFQRDGLQCTFIDETGRRCETRTFLELDHGTPRAHGGSDDASNLRTRCRSHNGLSAERAPTRRALATLADRWGPAPPPLESVLREALSILT
ncbi:HNH endonuclease [Pendulispora brunnea]|uniref:HNH endonuclease n=1 Tax=Pendulispora brunnea TaxID=2905690 RepID=A0ABZ2K2B4_9BACT